MKYIQLLFLLLFSSNIFAQTNLNNALLCDGNPETKTQDQLNAGALIEKIYTENNINTGSLCLGWTNLGSGNVWYEISNDMKVYGTNIITKQYLGAWPLGQDIVNEKGITLWWNGRWSSDEVIENDIIDLYDNNYFNWERVHSYNTDPNIMGCMQQKPLRYGDIEGDGMKELVIFLAGGYSVDFIIFSPQKHKTIFASKVDSNDVISSQDALASPYAESLPDKPEKHFQFYNRTNLEASRITFSNNIAGSRTLAKLYPGHFSAEDANDILVWRKLFFSRLLSDQIKGFEKKSDLLIHYKLINGEYKKQTTDPAVIKGWLTAKQLTWKKGYPSKSECPGQEGQYIPEMHDPLLNDPDVLQ